MLTSRRLLALSLLAFFVAAAPASADRPHPGSAGLGDRAYPLLGNGGYDAKHYSLDVRYPTSAPSQEVSGVVTMKARATQSLSRFNLDFSGDSVKWVRVNGDRADFRRDGEELVITPDRPLRRGSTFKVGVSYTGHPYVPPDPSVDPCPFGWLATNDGSVTAGQPNEAHSIYPVNDHPSDKASYDFKLDVPKGETAVANGVQTGKRTRGGRTVWSYEMRQPMASELIQLAVGDLTVVQRGRSAGVQIRDVEASSHAATLEPALSHTPAHVQWMVDRVGRYPFANYGVLAADQFFCYALETQTLSLHPAFLFEQRGPDVYDPVMVHELAHQWFGDSVAPAEWSDVWLNEGHATWYEQEYSTQFYGTDFEAYMRDAYARANQLRHDFGPVARPNPSEDVFTFFSDNVYSGGALVLYALRQKIGDPTFRVLERQWAQRNEGKSVSTEGFIRFASRVSHRDLRSFLRDWLYGTEVPPMPGHPDWTADPVQEMTTQSRAFAAPDSLLRKR
jgi:aminopeptidase N